MFRIRRAFSLAELLIVIGIIVLVLAMAVPAFNALTGSRSIESATNAISASLSRARLAAIQAQQPRGLVFYRDANNDRIAMALAGLNPTNGYIDVMPEADVQYLPTGVSIAFRHGTSSGYTYRLGTADLADLYGLVMFDSRGQVLLRGYQIHQNDEIARRLGITSTESTYSGGDLFTQPAFLLFERGLFDNQSFDDTDDENEWLEDNASVLLINRYNGTLTRSE